MLVVDILWFEIITFGVLIPIHNGIINVICCGVGEP